MQLAQILLNIIIIIFVGLIIIICLGYEVLGALLSEGIVLVLRYRWDWYLGVVRWKVLEAPMRVTFNSITIRFFHYFVNWQQLYKYRLIIILLQKELRIVLILNPWLIQLLTVIDCIILPLLAPTNLVHLQLPKHVYILHDNAINLLDQLSRGRPALMNWIQTGREQLVDNRMPIVSDIVLADVLVVAI